MRLHPVRAEARARTESGARAPRCVRLTHVVGSCSVCGRYGTVVHLVGDERARCLQCCPVCQAGKTASGSASTGPLAVLVAAARRGTAPAGRSPGPAPAPVLSSRGALSPSPEPLAVPSASRVARQTEPRATTRHPARSQGGRKTATKQRADSALTTVLQRRGPKPVQPPRKPVGRNQAATPRTGFKKAAAQAPTRKQVSPSVAAQKGSAKTAAAQKAATKGAAPLAKKAAAQKAAPTKTSRPVAKRAPSRKAAPGNASAQKTAPAATKKSATTKRRA
jgi:hypothetical protein